MCGILGCAYCKRCRKGLKDDVKVGHNDTDRVNNIKYIRTVLIIVFFEEVRTVYGIFVFIMVTSH